MVVIVHARSPHACSLMRGPQIPAASGRMHAVPEGQKGYENMQHTVGRTPLKVNLAF